MRKTGSTHYVVAKTFLRWEGVFDGAQLREVVEWQCVSEWDGPNSGRLRNPMMRCTTYYTEAEARRWARKYGVDCPTAAQAEPVRVRS